MNPLYCILIAVALGSCVVTRALGYAWAEYQFLWLLLLRFETARSDRLLVA